MAEELQWTLRPQRIVLSAATVLLFTLGAGRNGSFGPDIAVVIVVVALANLGWNLAALRGISLSFIRPGPYELQIVVDLALAMAAVMVVDAQTTPLAWILLLIPVLDASGRYGIRGALITWVGVSLLYMTVILALRSGDSAPRELVETGLQQSAAVIAVTISATAITTRTRSRLELTEAARQRAESKKHQLWIVSRAAQQMSAAVELGDVMAIANGAALSLGFDRADVSEIKDGRWTLLHSAGYPAAPPPADDRLLARALAASSSASVGLSRAASDDRQLLHDHGYQEATAVVAGEDDGAGIGLRGFRLLRSDDDLATSESMETLAAHVAVAVRNVRSRESLSKWAERLDHRAHHDELTGLPNRAYLLKHFPDEPELMASLLFLDLDGFKQINDTHGHDAGDVVLATVATRLGAIVAGNGFAARLGGDEFVLVACNRDRSGLEALARATAATVVEPIDIGETSVQVGTSIGIAEHRPGSVVDGHVFELLRQADAAMYQAKSEGRRVGMQVFAFADPDLSIPSVNR